jgi:hypothetical protein
MATAFSLVIVHPGTPSCYMVGQTGVCPIPARSLVAPLVTGMLGVCCVVSAGVAAVLGLSAQLDGGSGTTRENFSYQREHRTLAIEESVIMT